MAARYFRLISNRFARQRVPGCDVSIKLLRIILYRDLSVCQEALK
jgi:hypothetical protein